MNKNYIDTKVKQIEQLKKIHNLLMYQINPMSPIDNITGY